MNEVKVLKTSVVIATYNGSDFIIEELQSIMNQTIKPDEVIISDDNSCDDTAAMVEEFISENSLESWKLIKNEVNKGFSSNFMNALYQCSGDFVFLADQDDIWREDKIEVMLKNCVDNKDLSVLASEFDIIDSLGRDAVAPKEVPNTHCNKDGALVKIHSEKNIISSFIRGCTMMVSRKVIDYCKINMLEQFCSNNLLGHDWILWMVGSLLGNAYIIQQPLIKYRIHSNNSSLTAMQRKTLIGDVNKRKEGLEKSISAHEYILDKKSDFVKFSSKFERIIKRCISFEKYRLDFLQYGSLFTYLKLSIRIFLYRRYYRKIIRGFKIYIADLLYYRKGVGKND